MNIIIIEDEIKTAKALKQLILSILPTARIKATIASIETAVSHLSQNKSPDLIFMDVQLADGLCFEIFKEVNVRCPVIFCTAYDEYALEAFKSNGVDYVLKPFSVESVAAAVQKVVNLKNFFQTRENALPDFEALLERIGVNGKKGFLVFKDNKYVTLLTEKIAFFFIKDETPMLMTFDQQQYQANQPLDEVHHLLAESQFFRVNRQYLINYSAVKEVEHYFGRKLFVRLSIPTPEKLIVGKEKSVQFLNWLENR
ncbi:MAG: DNA-binding response regulator [Dyadobacter sp. 50-39]|uniref:LytR/AlgR family response regulator transcription factor n=1 Tax=Dyadobacter sp. 50-39 TaxID=1895756 RepID=UPI000958F30B|nr:LytTR family DNA-binding domain-containing protein [Dyadobacter sp. 50-39]OJV13254.1 MAG: DNA-binding response regulator [Dyadobacter sp. 50-39]